MTPSDEILEFGLIGLELAQRRSRPARPRVREPFHILSKVRHGHLQMVPGPCLKRGQSRFEDRKATSMPRGHLA